MRKRGKIFRNFKEVEGPKDNPVVVALAAINSNIKLVMELLADLRVNTSDDPKLDGEGRSDTPKTDKDKDAKK